MIPASYRMIRMCVALLISMASTSLLAQEDPGRTKVGSLEVTVFFATDGDPASAGEQAELVSEETRVQLESLKHLHFAHYRALGAETQPIFRTYENWAQPLKPSDEILVRFEPRSHPTEGSVQLDVELWLSRKKTLKTDVNLEEGKPLYVLGPKWRGGFLIVQVSLASQ
jgi:hypothetical protein